MEVSMDSVGSLKSLRNITNPFGIGRQLLISLGVELRTWWEGAPYSWLSKELRQAIFE
jgi:hypothetical protein